MMGSLKFLLRLKNSKEKKPSEPGLLCQISLKQDFPLFFDFLHKIDNFSKNDPILEILFAWGPLKKF